MPSKTQFTRRGSTDIYMDQLFVTTLDKMGKKLEDQIFYPHPHLAWMIERKNTERCAGGEQFRVPLLVSENPYAGWYREEEGMSLDDFDPFDQAIYYVKHLGAPIRWGKSIQRINRGDPAAFSIIDTKLTVTIKSLQRVQSDALMSGAGGTSVEMDGLPRLIPAVAGSSQSTKVGGITPSSNSWWQTQYINMAGIPATTGLEDNMIKMTDIIEDEGGKCDVIFTDRDTKRIYETNAMDKILTEPKKIGDNTFNLLQFKGGSIIHDKDAPIQEMRFVDNDAIEFCCDPMFWMRWTDWKELTNVPFTKTKQIVGDCNLARNQARNLGCIGNIKKAG